MTDVTFGPRAGRPAGAGAAGVAGVVPGARRPKADGVGGAAARAAARDEARRGRQGRPAEDVRPGRVAAAGTPRAARLLIGAGVAMLPWLVYLAAALPARATAQHWDTVWVGLDTVEMAGLVATGLLLRAGDPRRALTAAVTATLLACDAWFDCGTAATAVDRVMAYAMAAGAELPLAVALGVLAWRAFPAAVER